MCKAGGNGGNHPNYDKPHVPVAGKYAGEVRLSCVYCGRWLEEIDDRK